MKVRLAALLLTTSFALCYGQKAPDYFPKNVGEPPTALPSGCSTALIVQIHTLTGTDAYRSMRREVAALTLGHSATHQLSLAVADDPKATHIHQMVTTMTGLTDAQNTYLCASFLLGQDMPKKEDNRSIAVSTMISAFNRIALGMWQLQQNLRTAAEDAEASRKTSEVKQAEDLAQLMQDRKAAGSDVFDATTMMGLLAVDISDPNAAVADTLLITCSERETLLSEITPLTKSTDVDEFTQSAGLLNTVLTKHKCR